MTVKKHSTISAHSITATEDGTIIRTACGKEFDATPLVAHLPAYKRCTAIEGWIESAGGGLIDEFGSLRLAPLVELPA